MPTKHPRFPRGVPSKPERKHKMAFLEANTAWTTALEDWTSPCSATKQNQKTKNTSFIECHLTKGVVKCSKKRMSWRLTIRVSQPNPGARSILWKCSQMQITPFTIWIFQPLCHTEHGSCKHILLKTSNIICSWTMCLSYRVWRIYLSFPIFKKPPIRTVQKSFSPVFSAEMLSWLSAKKNCSLIGKRSSMKTSPKTWVSHQINGMILNSYRFFY